jgi:hypothetical protein
MDTVVGQVEPRALHSEDFEESVFVKGALEAHSAERLLATLDDGLRKVNLELGSKVSERYETLLTNAQAARGVESKLVRSNDRVEALAQAVRRTQTQCARPYGKLCVGAAQLERMQETAEMLRATHRAVVLCKRLHESLPGPNRNPHRHSESASTSDTPTRQKPPAAASVARGRGSDLPKAAAALQELEEILASVDLSGIEVVDVELPFIRESAHTIRTQATAMLRAGLAEHSQAQTGAALQVFFNLGELQAATAGVAAHVAAGVNRAVVVAFDPSIFGADAASKLGGGGGVLGDLGGSASSRKGVPPASAAAGWRHSLWAKAEAVAEALFVAALQLVELQRVLAKKRDPLSHALFASLFEEHDGEAGAPPHLSAATPVHAHHRWAQANVSLLEQDALLASILGNGDARPNAAASAPSAIGTVMMTATGNVTTDDELVAPRRGDGTAALFAAQPKGLLSLWAPLAIALRDSLERSSAASPFVRQTLSTELPRLLGLLRGAAKRVEQHLLPTVLPAEAALALGAPAMLQCLSPTKDRFQRDLIAVLNAKCDAQLNAAAAALPERGLGVAIEAELKRCAGTPQLQRIAVAACAQAVGIFAARAETMVRWGDADADDVGSVPLMEGHAAAAAGERVSGASAANGELLIAVQALRADVHAAVDAHAGSDDLGAPLLQALGRLGAACAALANPATPLPEARRADAAAMLKSILRREMIDAENML